MKTERITQLGLLTLAVAMLAGCASPSSHFYTLNPTATTSGTPAARYAIAVGPVSVPGVVDRPQFTVSVPPNGVQIDEFNRWAEPLNQNIARVVAADLSVLLGATQVSAVPLANFDPAYRVTINIQQFESVPGKSVRVEALWIIRQSAGGAVQSGRTLADEPVSGDGFAALAAAHSRALAKVSGDIAAAIRTDAAGKP